MFVHDYIQKMKDATDMLSASGTYIFYFELILYILSGLGLAINVVVVNLTLFASRCESFTLEESQFELQAYEKKLARQTTTYFVDHQSSSLPSSAFYVVDALVRPNGITKNL